MKRMIGIECYRAFHGKGFKIAMILGGRYWLWNILYLV